MSGEIYSHGGVLEFHFNNAPTHTPREKQVQKPVGTGHHTILGRPRSKQAFGLLQRLYNTKTYKKVDAEKLNIQKERLF